MLPASICFVRTTWESFIMEVTAIQNGIGVNGSGDAGDLSGHAEQLIGQARKGAFVDTRDLAQLLLQAKARDSGRGARLQQAMERQLDVADAGRLNQDMEALAAAEYATEADRGTAARSELEIVDGVAQNERILQRAPAGNPSISGNLERGAMPQVNGLIVHQTDGYTAASTFGSYSKRGAEGAHFLIDKDGTIYQTASLNHSTLHVGKLKSRCKNENSCSSQDNEYYKKWSPKRMHERESGKPAGERYPYNKDSIGIELVGKALPEGVPDDQKIYETVTDEQNGSLRWLVQQLKAEYGFLASEIFKHSEVSYKNETEAKTARW